MINKDYFPDVLVSECLQHVKHIPSHQKNDSS